MELMKKLSVEKISDYRKHAQMINRIRNRPYTSIAVLIILALLLVGLVLDPVASSIILGVYAAVIFVFWLLFKVLDEL